MENKWTQWISGFGKKGKLPAKQQLLILLLAGILLVVVVSPVPDQKDPEIGTGAGQEETETEGGEATEQQYERLLDKRVETLSMGQKKKAALLCGLCSGMQVILFDEPSLGVDIDGIEELKSIIKKVHQEYQITFLISSHDMSFLSDIASEYIFMSGGRIKLEHHGPADHKDIMEKYQKLIR